MLEVSETLENVETRAVENIQAFPVVFYLLVLGMCISSLRVGIQLVSISKNVRKFDVETHGKYKYVLMDKHYATRSFFRFIFVRKSEYLGGHINEVLLHEQVHVDKWHSLDVLIVGFLSILQWFNPFIYLVKRAIAETHEFQADQVMLDSGTDRVFYQQLLLSQARSNVFAGFTSNFNQSLVKNRFRMMNRIKSGKSAVVKYVMMIPVIFAFSIVFGISQEKFEESVSELVLHSPNEPIIGRSKIVQIDLKSDIASIETDGGVYHDQDSDKIHFLENKVAGKTEGGSFSLSADNIYFDDTKKTIYGYSNHYAPSIYPVAKKI